MRAFVRRLEALEERVPRPVEPGVVLMPVQSASEGFTGQIVRVRIVDCRITQQETIQ